MSYKEIEEFVTEGSFVNPEKVTDIDLYGFNTAKEMWKDGEPGFAILQKLQTIACHKALNGIL